MTLAEVSARDLFDRLDTDVQALFFTRGVFQQLFSEGTLEDLNRTAPGAFKLIQAAMVHEILRHLCVLTDPPTPGKRENLVLRRVIDRARAECNVGWIDAIDQSMSCLSQMHPKFKEFRDKRLFHCDLKAKLGHMSVEFPLRDEVEQAIEHVAQIMSSLSQVLGGSPVSYSESIVRGDGVSIVSAIRRSSRLLELNRQAWNPDVSAAELQIELQKRGQ